MSMLEAIEHNPGGGIGSMAQVGAGMAIGVEMMKQMGSMMSSSSLQSTKKPSKATCSGCGHHLSLSAKFCPECGMKVVASQPIKQVKFCPECGHKIGE